jgi:hypothetical protein
VHAGGRATPLGASRVSPSTAPARGAVETGTLAKMNVELTAPERDLLLEMLRDDLGHLKGEIYRTETFEYKEELKAREQTLVGIIGRLEGSQGS